MNKKDFDQTKSKDFKGKGKPRDLKPELSQVKYGKGKKPSKDFKDKEVKQDVANDPAWYLRYPKLMEAAGKIAFNHRNGKPYTIRGAFSGYTVTNNRQNSDALVRYVYLPNPGISADGSSAINLMSKSAWKMLNRRYRGSLPYQMSDFGIIQFGILDFFSSLSEAERIYGVLNRYSLNQTQVPKGLLLALGVDPESFVDLADFRARLNRLIVAARTLCLVKGYTLLDKSMLITSNIFKDKDTARGQLFAFVKPGYWLYDPTNVNGSSLVFMRYETPTKWENSDANTLSFLRTQDSIIRDLTLQLNALLNDDDVDRICSDVLAFYGNKEDSADLVTLSVVPEEHVVAPIFSDDINRQIHNAYFIHWDSSFNTPGYSGTTALSHFNTIVPSTFGGTNLCIYQENNAIKFNITYADGTVGVTTDGGYKYARGSAIYNCETPVVDTDYESPDVGQVAEMTQLTNIWEGVSITDSGTYYYYECKTCGTILPLWFQGFNLQSQEYTYTAVTATGYDHLVKMVTYSFYENTGSVLATTDYIFNIELYDWHPVLYKNQSSSGGNIVRVLADLDNYIAITVKELFEIHDIGVMSQFKIPMIDMILSDNE